MDYGEASIGIPQNTIRDTDESKSAPALENISRLASRPGVRATLILSRKDGIIIQSTGLQTKSEPAKSQDSSPLADGEQKMASVEDDEYGSSRTSSGLNAGEVAKLVFQFVTAASSFSNGVEEGDDVQLLTLRTKKSEFIIIPGNNAFRATHMQYADGEGQIPTTSLLWFRMLLSRVPNFLAIVR